MTGAGEMLRHAAGLVEGERARLHGDGLENMANVASLINAYLAAIDFSIPDRLLHADDAAIMLMLVKLARTKGGTFNPDDYIDMAGYAAIAGECRQWLAGKAPFTVDAPDGSGADEWPDESGAGT